MIAPPAVGASFTKFSVITHVDLLDNGTFDEATNLQSYDEFYSNDPSIRENPTGELSLSAPLSLMYRAGPGNWNVALSSFSGTFDARSVTPTDPLSSGGVRLSGEASGSRSVTQYYLSYLIPAAFDWIEDDRFILDYDGTFTCVGRCELVGYDHGTYFESGLVMTGGRYSVAAIPLPATGLMSLGMIAALMGVRFSLRSSAPGAVAG
jgi:hypothetical protein